MTNVGLYLTDVVAALDFGFISQNEAEVRIAAVLNSLERLPKWRGHPYEWVRIAPLEPEKPFLVSTVASGWLAAGLLVAFRLYLLDPTAAARLAGRFQGLYRLLLNKYWVDELYDAIAVRPFVRASNWLWQWVDDGVIDGAVNGVGYTLVGGGAALRLVQSGQAQSYAFYTLLGALIVIAYVLARG